MLERREKRERGMKTIGMIELRTIVCDFFFLLSLSLLLISFWCMHLCECDYNLVYRFYIYHFFVPLFASFSLQFFIFKNGSSIYGEQWWAQNQSVTCLNVPECMRYIRLYIYKYISYIQLRFCVLYLPLHKFSDHNDHWSQWYAYLKSWAICYAFSINRHCRFDDICLNAFRKAMKKKHRITTNNKQFASFFLLLIMGM